MQINKVNFNLLNVKLEISSLDSGRREYGDGDGNRGD